MEERKKKKGFKVDILETLFLFVSFLTKMHGSKPSQIFLLLVDPISYACIEPGYS